MKENSNKNKISNLGKVVQNWKEGMKLEDEQLVHFCLEHKMDPSSSFNQSEIQSLISKALSSYCYSNNKKEQKERKETQEIDEMPPEEQEEQEEAHGGREDEHQDIKESQDQDNQSNQQQNNSQSQQQSQQQSSQNQGNNSQSESESNTSQSQQQSQQKTKSKDSSSKDSSDNNRSNSNNKKQQVAQIIKNNKKANKKFEQFMNEYGSTEKSEITLAQNTSRKVGYGGGGARMDDANDTDFNTFKSIQDFLIKLASDDAPMGRLEGKAKWDGNKIVKSRFNGDFNNAKFDRPKERNIWFIVDDSGSVSRFAEFIMSMIQGAANVVNVVHGSEAKPCNWVKLPKVNKPKILRLSDLDTYKVWHQEFKYSFIECLENFIKECEIKIGDVLVFWGDLMDALESNTDTPEVFRKLLRSYKCYWLLSHNGNSPYYGNHTRVIEMSKAFKMLYEINDSISLRKAIQKIK